MKAKKSLGQNFLKSEPVLKKIVETGEINKDDLILEIGPGKGALTKKLLETGANVLAVEKDDELFIFLQEKFSEEIQNKKLLLINEDILDFNIKDNLFFRGVSQADEPRGRAGRARSDSDPKKIELSLIFKKPLKYKIIANIPYNITGAILKKFLTEENQPDRMVLMVQHEVAKRIIANDKKESILSISVKAYGEPKMITKVPARYFSPAPKVDSAVIVIKNISRKNFTSKKEEETFWEIVKLAFAHKRKKLSGNLKSFKDIKVLPLDTIKDMRAEDLTLKDWLELTKFVSKH